MAKGILGGSVAAGFERQPQYVGIQTVSSSQTFEEPSAEVPAPPAIIEVRLNRELRHALGIPKGELAKFVADQSVKLTELEESIDDYYRKRTHRQASTGKDRFRS